MYGHALALACAKLNTFTIIGCYLEKKCKSWCQPDYIKLYYRAYYTKLSALKLTCLPDTTPIPRSCEIYLKLFKGGIWE